MKKPERRRLDGSLLVSIALHIVLGAALVAILSIPNPIEQWLTSHHAAPVPVEHITYIAAPSAASAPARIGGDNVPVRGKVRSRPLVAPTTIPTTVPPAPASTEPPSGSGPVVGGGGPGEGVTPSYGDPRVWAPTGPIYYAPKTQAERLDSALSTRVFAHNDSMALYNSGKKPGDWTFEKNGQKYGMDSQKIYLGKLALPTALLALLPLNVQGNPARYQNDRMKESQRQEIYLNAQRAMDNDEFKDAVKHIRERKDREHKAELAAKRAQQQAEQQAQQNQQPAATDQSTPPAPPPPPPPPPSPEPAQIP
ncbi:MAG: hypothetical protein JJD97_01875 [Gemmatimonadaceae bacterium]|nr:hypothetical protein [Gemmatimonadaceae bacterium]